MSNAFLVLSEDDRKRFGCTDQLRFALADITAREQATLQKAFGYHSPDDILAAISDMVKGERIVRDPDLYLALTWIGLRQGGHLTARRPDDMAAELAELDIQLARTVIDSEPGSEGKAESSTPTRTSTA